MALTTKSAVNLSANPASNRRIKTRTNCSIPATIKHNGLCLGDCVIKDISETGMRLFAPSAHWVPQDFEIHSSTFDGVLLVTKMWVETEHIGVSFQTS